MPTFDFHCTACDTTFEKTLPFGSKGKPVCPECKSKKTEKMISMPSVVFKGSGFYKTDSKGALPKKTSEPAKTEPATPQPKPEDASKKTEAPKKIDATKP